MGSGQFRARLARLLMATNRARRLFERLGRVHHRTDDGHAKPRPGGSVLAGLIHTAVMFSRLP